MKKYYAIFITTFYLIVFSSSITVETQNAASLQNVASLQKQPNIIFILSDDQRWDTLGTYGNKDIQTPNIDTLAEEGAKFTSFYVAAPLCCPSRGTFLTGLYPHQTGILTNEHGKTKLPDGIKTVGDYLNEAGYLTGYVGKWHLEGQPRQHGFTETTVWLPAGGSPHRNPYLVVNGKKEELDGVIKYDQDGDDEIHPREMKNEKQKMKNKNLKLKQVHGLITEIFANAAIEFIKKHKNDTFFLYLATTAPHTPYYNDPKFPYKAENIKQPPGWTDGKFSPSDWTGYYSTISHLDYNIGKILTTINELELDNNTVIIYTSDNGFMMGSHNRYGKQVWYEESVHVPFIIKWKNKINSNSVINTPVSAVDILPTLINIASLNNPKPTINPIDNYYEGKSILPAVGIEINNDEKNGSRKLQPESNNLREIIFSEVKQKGSFGGRHWQMVKTEDYKYVWFSDGEEILYNLKEDPNELKNLIGAIHELSLLDKMRKLRENWLEATPDVIRQK